MIHKTIYNKQALTELTTVAGNISDAQQCYQIFYYPKSLDLPQKVALFTYLVPPSLKEKGIMPKPRSLYFSSLEQLKTLIFDLTNSYFYFLDKRIKPVIPIEEFRLIKLDEFFKDLRQNQTNIWKR